MPRGSHDCVFVEAPPQLRHRLEARGQSVQRDFRGVSRECFDQRLAPVRVDAAHAADVPVVAARLDQERECELVELALSSSSLGSPTRTLRKST